MRQILKTRKQAVAFFIILLGVMVFAAFKVYGYIQYQNQQRALADEQQSIIRYCDSINWDDSKAKYQNQFYAGDEDFYCSDHLDLCTHCAGMPEAPTTQPACTVHCSKGKPCGDSCINVNYNCYQPPGKACY